MCDTVFAFGQRGAYHIESPSKWQRGALPAKLKALLTKIASVHCLAFGVRDSFFISYSGKDKLNHIYCDGIPKQLKDFLYEKDSSGSFVRSFSKICVTLGPYNESWWATDGTFCKWHDLPQSLDAAVKKLRKAGGGFSDTPRLVALGANGGYLMLTKSNSCTWSLSASYRELDALLDAMKDGDVSFSVIQNIVLDAYRLQSFVFQSKNGYVVAGAGIAPHVADAMTDMIATIKSDTDEKRARELKAEAAKKRARELKAEAAQAQELHLLHQQLQQLQRQQAERELLILRANQIHRANQAAVAMNALSLGVVAAAFGFNSGGFGGF